MAPVMLALWLLFSLAHADTPKLGTPTYSGDGCPANTVSTLLSFDGLSLSVLWDQFIAEAGKRTGVTYQRRTCTLVLPLIVPRESQASVTQVDYRGFLNLPKNGYAQMTVDYFYDEYRSPRITRRYPGPIEQKDFFSSYRLRKEDIRWSKCGQPITIQVTASVVVQSNALSEEATVSVDSADIASQPGLQYALQWRRCN